MQRAEQLSVRDQIFTYIDTRTTATVDDIYRQPVDEYISSSIASREHEQLFRSRPLCVGLSGLIPHPGSFATHDLSGLPIILTRGDDGRARAFLNVCRHRGARVAEACGTTRAFTCPYHAWSYNLDGRLVGRPDDAAFGGAPRHEHGLVPLATLEQDGLLWVLPRPETPFDGSAHMHGLNQELAAYDFGAMHHYASRTLHRRMNWKLLLDTFLESYHFCVLHKHSICSIFYDNLGTFDAYGPHFRLVSPRRTIESMREVAAPDVNLLPYIVALYVLFPNTVLVWQLDHVELWQIFPGPNAPDDGLVQLSLYTPAPATTSAARQHWDKNLELVLHVVENEDFPLGEGIQRGFHTGAQDFITFGRNEPGLTHFHRTLSAALQR